MADDKQQETATKHEPAARTAATRASSGAVLAAVTLVAGALGGWFARGAIPRAGASSTARLAASAAAGTTDACEEWRSEICKRTGESSEGCAKAKEAAAVLPGSACTTAKADVEATVAKMKAAHAACDTLVDKLCADLGAKSRT